MNFKRVDMTKMTDEELIARCISEAMYLDRSGTQYAAMTLLRIVAKRMEELVARDNAQITHHSECWRYHQACAVRKIEDLLKVDF